MTWYSVYWNPAGLTELKGRTRRSVSEIQDMARKGNVEDIQEEELLQYAEGGGDRFFFQVWCFSFKAGC